MNTLNERIFALNTSATRQDAKIDQLSKTLTEVRQSLETSVSENQQLKVDKQVLKAAEARFIREVADLTRDRNASNDRIREFQDLLDEKDRQTVVQVKKLENQLEELNREL